MDASSSRRERRRYVFCVSPGFIASRDAKSIEIKKFDNLAHAAGMVDVIVAGDRYKLLRRPVVAWSRPGRRKRRPEGPQVSSAGARPLTSRRSLTARAMLPFDNGRHLDHPAAGFSARRWSSFFSSAHFSPDQTARRHPRRNERAFERHLVTTSRWICSRTRRSPPRSTISCRCSQRRSPIARTTKSRQRSNSSPGWSGRSIGPEFPGPKFPEVQSVSDLAGSAKDDPERPLLTTRT